MEIYNYDEACDFYGVPRKTVREEKIEWLRVYKEYLDNESMTVNEAIEEIERGI